MPIDSSLLEYIKNDGSNDKEIDLTGTILDDADYQLLADSLTNHNQVVRIVWPQVPPLDNSAVDRIYQLLERNKRRTWGIQSPEATLASLQSVSFSNGILNSTAQVLFKTAQDLYSQGQWQAARERLDNILTLQSKCNQQPGVWLPEVYAKLACCYVAQAFSVSGERQLSLYKQAKQAFETTLVQPDITLAGLKTRVHCDYGQFLYQQGDYAKACEQVSFVIRLNASHKAKWLSYEQVEYSRLLNPVRTRLAAMGCNQITDRTLAYAVLLYSQLAAGEWHGFEATLADFAGETYQGVEPVAYQLLADIYQQQGHAVAGKKALQYSEWTQQELKAVSAIKDLQGQLSELAVPFNHLKQADKPSEEEIYQALADAFNELGDIYLHKQGYTKATGLHAIANCIHQTKLKQLVMRVQASLLLVEQALINNMRGEQAPVLSLATWQKQQDFYRLQLMTIRQQAKQSLAEHYNPLNPSSVENQVEKIAAMRFIFSQIAQGMQRLIQQMVEDAYGMLGEPPCRYAILGLGSMAREEITPYSDMEWAILIEEETTDSRKYFNYLAELLAIKVTSLGETVLPSLAIESLNPHYTESTWSFFDDITPRGFAMDGAMPEACKTPQGKRDRQGKIVFQLIQTPQHLAAYIGQTPEGRYWVDQETTLPTVLINAILLAGDEGLLHAYRQAAWQVLQGTLQDRAQPLYRYIMYKLLDKNLQTDEFVPNAGDAGQLFDAKKNLYRIPNLIIDELALYYEVELMHTSGVQKLAELARQEKLNPVSAQRLTYVLLDTMRYRLQTYLHYQAQQEEMNPLLHAFVEEDLKDKQYAISSLGLSCIQYSLQVLIPLYEIMKHFRQDVEKGDHLLKITMLNEINLYTQGKIAMRLHQYNTAEKFYLQALESEDEHPSESSNLKLAAIYNSLGYLYDKLGDNTRRLSYFQQGLLSFLEAANNIPPNMTDSLSLEVVASMNNISAAYQLAGEFTQASSFYEKTLSIFDKVYGEKHPNTGILQNNIGMFYQTSGQFSQALEAYSKALVIWDQCNNSGKYNSHKALVLNNLGGVYDNLGNFSAALTNYIQALKMRRKIYGGVHPAISNSLNNIGETYRKLGKANLALDYFQQALMIRGQLLYGKQHPEVANLKNNIGLAYDLLGDAKQALDNYQQALIIRKQIYGEQHPDIASSLNNIGTAYKALGNTQQALKVFEQAETIFNEVYREKQSLQTAILLNNIGITYKALGYIQQALKKFEQAIVILKQTYNEQHPMVATLLNNIGEVYRNLGDPKPALEKFQQAIAILKQTYGEQHPEIATSLNNIGEVYRNLGAPKLALETFKQAIAVLELTYGERHPMVAKLLNNIGVTYNTLGKARKALVYYQQVLVIFRQFYGEQHPEIATSLNNIGEVYRKLGYLKPALETFKQAIAILKLTYGKHHPMVAILLNNIGVTYNMLGQVQEAFACHQKALVIFKQFYGEEHPEVATSLSNLGEIYMASGRFKKALNYYQLAFVIVQKIYGDKHPIIAKLFNSMGTIYESLDHIPQALAYHTRALEMRKLMYDGQHPDLAISLNNIGIIYHKLGDTKQALDYFTQALAIQEKIYGEQHSEVATTNNNIGAVYHALGKIEQALDYYQRALIIRKQINPDLLHADVANSLNNMGTTYYALGKKEKALVYFKQAYNICEKIYGEQHPEVATFINNIGVIYRELDDGPQALAYAQRALAIREQIYGKQHLDIADSLRDIGKAYNLLGNKESSLSYLKQALRIYKEVYNNSHPKISDLDQLILHLEQPKVDNALASSSHTISNKDDKSKSNSNDLLDISATLGVNTMKAFGPIGKINHNILQRPKFRQQLNNELAKHNIVIVYGTKNIGKTELAKHHLSHLRDKPDIYWFNCQTSQILLDSLYQVAKDSALVSSDFDPQIKQKHLISLLKKHFRESANWFIVLNDVVDTSILELLPDFLHDGKVIITTSLPKSDLPAHLPAFKLPKLSLDELEPYVKEILGDQQPSDFSASLDKILQLSGGKPLEFCETIDVIKNFDYSLKQFLDLTAKYPNFSLGWLRIDALNEQAQQNNQLAKQAETQATHKIANYSRNTLFGCQPSDFLTAFYNIEQPKFNTIILQRLNELTGIIFTGYFRMDEDFVLDAVLVCGDEKMCRKHADILKHCAIKYEVKSAPNHIFYLVVPEINSTQVGSWITVQCNEKIGYQTSEPGLRP